MSAIITTELVHAGAIPEIKQGEVCEREPCGAQARVRVKLLSDGLLDFCKHHFERMEDALRVASGGLVRDQRHELDVKIGLGIAPGVPPSLPSNRMGGTRA